MDSELKAKIIRELEDYISDIKMIISDNEQRQIDSGESLDDPDYLDNQNYYKNKIKEVEELIKNIKS